ncbi:MAG: hypothetical protein DI571_11140, partial [Arsenicicoccus sp.]
MLLQALRQHQTQGHPVDVHRTPARRIGRGEEQPAAVIAQGGPEVLGAHARGEQQIAPLGGQQAAERLHGLRPEVQLVAPRALQVDVRLDDDHVDAAP